MTALPGGRLERAARQAPALWPVALALALLSAGCDEEPLGPGQATPISPTAARPLPPGPPAHLGGPAPTPQPVAAAQPPTAPAQPGGPAAPSGPSAPSGTAAPSEPAEPAQPGGLTRARLGDMVEFSWSRVDGVQIDPGEVKRMAVGAKGRSEPPRAMVAPKPALTTGTLTVVRVEPEQPFTFRVELKSSKAPAERALFSYGPDIPLEKVRFGVDPDEPRKKAKVAGTVFDCVETERRRIAPEPASLALAGGLLSQSLPEAARTGAVSVVLTRLGTARAAAVKGETAKVLDSFETPIAIAIQQVEKFGVLDPDVKSERDSAVRTQLTKLAGACRRDLKPPTGTLGVVIAAGKLGGLSWNEGPAPQRFDKCFRQQLKKLKLPQDQLLLELTF